MIDISTHADDPEAAADLMEDFEVVREAHFRFPTARPYVWLRHRSTGRLELAK